MFSILSFLFCLGLISFASMTSYVVFFTCIAIGLFSFSYIFDITRSKFLKLYAIPLIGGYFLRILFLFYDAFSYKFLNLPLIGGDLTSDPLGFYNSAFYYSLGYPISYGGAFPKLIGFVFSFTAPSRLWGEFLVLLFSTMTIHIFAIILAEIDVPNIVRKRSMYFLCFLPNYLLLSVVFRRETVITFFIALSLLFFVKWFNGHLGEKSFLLSVICALIASLFHGATGLIVIGFLIVHLFYSPKRKKFSLETINIITGICLIVLFLVVFHSYGTLFFDKVTRRFETDNYSITGDAGGSSYAQYVGDNSTLYRTLVYSIPRFAYFMFSPFPWQWRGFSDVATFLLSSCFYFIILFKTVYYIIIVKNNCFNRNLLISLLFIALFIGSAFSWGVINTGTAIRHRDKFIVLYSLMYCLSWLDIKNLPLKKIK